ncbi:unnamed protein product [Effrenium voratum]|uniref:Uncharacterized protein n=1 Tax=Effrenium voratum TaxID=2562239 RepID=A0AA36JPI3_9DINO|nr:unnamed protein product [Effrenium voratum]CAJ1409379.1 unnamed protein product [Effrenium voratum]CAJ1459219.1 unnamed protein product [Effrenium voratum]
MAEVLGAPTLVHVALLSGRSVALVPKAAETLRELRLRAEQELQLGLDVLLGPEGQALPEDSSLEALGLGHLVAVARQARLCSGRCSQAFALIRADGSVATWGLAKGGGDSHAVWLRQVRQICASAAAFAALRQDGRVVTWGRPKYGGHSLHVWGQLHDVRRLAATCGAFAALRSSGQVVAWGSTRHGAPSRGGGLVAEEVVDLVGANTAFAALQADGTVVTWPRQRSSGLRLRPPLWACFDSFAALDDRGEMVVFDSLAREQARVPDVAKVAASAEGFCFLLKDGSVVSADGEVHSFPSPLRELCASGYAFAGIGEDGAVRAWGDPAFGGDCSAVQEQLKDVQVLVATDGAFAALRCDGVVVAWGDAAKGGDCGGAQLTDICQLCASSLAFAALRDDGRVISWGNLRGGEPPAGLRG